MRINYNYTAAMAQNSLSLNDQKYSVSLGKLSSGKKVVNAKDNPSGLAMSRRMNAQIKGMQEANKNAQNAINVVKTTDGALSEMHEMLQRMSELAVKSATETLESEDREYIQSEVAKLKEEIQRIRDTTQFNGQNLLDGSFGPRAYCTLADQWRPEIKVAEYGGITEENLVINGINVEVENSGDGAVKIKSYDLSGLQVKAGQDGTGEDIFTDMDKVKNNARVRGDRIELSDGTGRSITLQIDMGLSGSDPIQVQLPYNENNGGTAEDRTRYGMTIQVDSNEGSFLNAVIPDVSIDSLGVGFVDVSTPDGALEAIDDIKNGIQKLSQIRSDIGAIQNRLEHTVEGLNINEENTTASYSTLMDLDMAEEMVTYTTYQVLTQTGTSMLAQANQRVADLLQLIQ